MMTATPMTAPIAIIVPRQVAAEHALRHRRHEVRLRGFERLRMFGRARTDAVALREHVERRRHDQRADDTEPIASITCWRHGVAPTR